MNLEKWYYAAGVGVFVLMLLSALGIDIKRWTKMPDVPGGNASLVTLAVLGILLTAWGLYRSYSTEYKDSDTAPPVVDQTFRNEKVEIDGKDFRRCTFENVTFVYRGKRSFKMQNCQFNGQRIIQPASPEVEGTVLLLKGLGFLPSDMKWYSKGPLPLVESPVSSPQPPTK